LKVIAVYCCPNSENRKTRNSCLAETDGRVELFNCDEKRCNQECGITDYPICECPDGGTCRA